MTYVNPRSVTACGILFPILGTIAVILRFKTRYRRKAELKVDDWLCIPALVSSTFLLKSLQRTDERYEGPSMGRMWTTDR